MVAAHAVYQEHSFLKWELEARLLANEPVADIAAKCKLAPEAVEAYEEVFYRVRSYLKAEVYILAMAIGTKAIYGLRESDIDVLLKIVGYGLGAEGVDSMLAAAGQRQAQDGTLARLAAHADIGILTRFLPGIRGVIVDRVVVAPAVGIGVTRSLIV